MKKFLSIITILMLFSVSAYGQGFGWGIKGGVSSATVALETGGETVPTTTEALVGPVAGAFLSFDLVFLNLQVDALYAQKGYKTKVADQDVDIKLNYLSIPAVAKFVLFPIAIKPYLAGGVEYSYLLSVDGGMFDLKKDDFSSSDFGLVAAAGIDLGLQVIDLNVDLRYIYGMNNVANIADVPGVELKNQAFQITAGIQF